MKRKFTFFLFLFLTICLELGANNQILNFNNSIKKASQNNKQVIVFFHMTHCGYCKRMRNKTFQDRRIQELIHNNFIFVDINIDDNEKIIFNSNRYTRKEFAENFDVDFFPTVLFFDENSEITYTARGYRKIKKFRKILQYINTKSYENIDFFDYDKSKIDKE